MHPRPVHEQKTGGSSAAETTAAHRIDSGWLVKDFLLRGVAASDGVRGGAHTAGERKLAPGWRALFHRTLKMMKHSAERATSSVGSSSQQPQRKAFAVCRSGIVWKLVGENRCEDSSVLLIRIRTLLSVAGVVVVDDVGW